MDTSPVIQISLKTVLMTAALVAALWLVWTLRDVVFLLFSSLLLSTLIRPFADWLASKKMPRSLSVIVVYVAFLGTITAVVSLLIPAVIAQSSAFSDHLSGFVTRLTEGEGFARVAREVGITQHLEPALRGFTTEAGSSLSSVFSTLRGVFGAIGAVIAVLVLTFYLVIEEDALRRAFTTLVPSSVHHKSFELFARVQKTLASWLRGQLILGLLVGTLVFIGLTLMGVPYALLLAVLAGLLEIIPYVGPILSAIPAVLIAASDSPAKGIFVILLCILIQQIENHVLVPKVTERTTGLNPLVSLISLLIGLHLAGLVGALLAIPTVVTLSVILKEWHTLHSSSPS